MDFQIAHTVPASPPDVASALLDEDYQRSLQGVGRLKERTLMSQTTNPDGTVTRHVRCVLAIELGGVVRSLVGDGDPAWIERATWDPGAMRWDWAIEPELGAELLSASGAIELRATDSGTERVVTGHVAVKVPVYGSKVERWVVEGLTKAYTEEADRLTEWLAR